VFVITKVDECRICESKDLSLFLDFGQQPFANALLNSPTDPDPNYPLALIFCNTCSLVQLAHRPGQEDLFSTYLWVTGTSKKIHEFSQVFCEALLSRTSKLQKNYVLEIASNDGTLLKPFKKRGYEVLGIDPAKNIAEMANKAGIPTQASFWGKETAQKFLNDRGKSNVVFARNVLPHVSNQRDFVESLSLVLTDDGVLAIEVHYAGVILRELHYDSVYHEHHCYFSLKTLEFLLNKYGLYIFDIMESPISGGSIIAYARKQKSVPSDAVKKYREMEKKECINSLLSWQGFSERCKKHRENLLSILRELNRGGMIAGYGASARSSTMLNYCRIKSNLLPIIADKNPLKQGKYTAGTHIPIITLEKMIVQKPVAVFILSWNFKDEIIEELRANRFSGKFLIPFPDPPQIYS